MAGVDSTQEAVGPQVNLQKSDPTSDDIMGICLGKQTLGQLERTWQVWTPRKKLWDSRMSSSLTAIDTTKIHQMHQLSPQSLLFRSCGTTNDKKHTPLTTRQVGIWHQPRHFL